MGELGSEHKRAQELTIDRAGRRSTSGSTPVERGVIREWIADSRMEIDQARLDTLCTAHLMDTVRDREAASEISGIEVVVPDVARRVVDRAMQVFGGAGLCQDTPLARMYAETRIVRIADGPDAVHRRALARTELRRFEEATTPAPRGATSHPTL